jgi:hypothetical protein
MNTILNIKSLAADCVDSFRCATPRASVNFQQIGEIAHQELTGKVREQIGNVLCTNMSAVVCADRIIAICEAA